MDLVNQIWQGSGLYQISVGQLVMLGICLALLYLGIAKKFEPLLLVTIGFGGLLSNIPGVEIATGSGLLYFLYNRPPFLCGITLIDEKSIFSIFILMFCLIDLMNIIISNSFIDCK